MKNLEKWFRCEELERSFRVRNGKLEYKKFEQGLVLGLEPENIELLRDFYEVPKDCFNHIEILDKEEAEWEWIPEKDDWGC